MTKYTKSPIDELFYSLMGFYPTKEGAAYEIISVAALSLLERREAKTGSRASGSAPGWRISCLSFGLSFVRHAPARAP